MAEMTIKITGADHVITMLKSMPSEVVSKRHSPVKKALLKAGRVIQSEAKKNVARIIAEPNIGPQYKSTGTLIKHIIVSRSRMNSGENGEKYIVRLKPGKRIKYAETRENVRRRRVGRFYNLDSPAFYGRLLEYGTSRMRAHPWLRPAVMSKGREAIKTAVDFLVIEIDRIAKRLAKGGNVS